nr:LTA synthase family protein [Chryseobacterium sp.]
MLNPNFPFWRKENTPDFLGTYFIQAKKTPNLVFIVMEGFGHAYTSSGGYIGNFTPFLDSLASKSLSWENSLSSAGRTFGALPSLTGSLPVGKNGFLEIKNTPKHFNLYNILKTNGFETGFYYGGDVSFDRYKEFLIYSKVDHIIDKSSFSAPYRKLPASNGESWGYEDQAVFSKMLEIQKQQKPYFNMILTLSTHNPFLINNKEYYEKLYDQKINSEQLLSEQKKWAKIHKNQLISVLNADDALRAFFKSYRKRSDFNNTIFMVTGDHSMPEIMLESTIDRYHVPLFIYSPLLKEPKKFYNTVSHFDLAPSILAYYRNNYKLNTPSTVTWVGRGFSFDSEINNGIPMMQSKNQLIDFVSGKYYLHDEQLFILDNLEEDIINNTSAFDKIKKHFNQFKSMNSRFYNTQKIMPDSVIVNFMKKNK